MDQVLSLVETILSFLDGILGASIWFVIFLLGVGVLGTIILGFPQFRMISRAFRVLLSKDRVTGQGTAGPFGALSTALSGTIGTGNIGGVAFALFLGGPAALFWMWVTAFLGMSTKMIEVTLSHRYRTLNKKGEIEGGPMYVLDKALNMKWLAIIFCLVAIISSIGTGNMPQINNIASAVSDTFSIPRLTTGLALGILLLFIIRGGIKRIVQTALIAVPGMSLLYCLTALFIIVYNYDEILPSLGLIFGGIWDGTAAVGGFLGATFAVAMERGVQRGLFSNEAGQGSAPIAHAISDTESPVEEGMVGLIEPFIDTIIICTLTGLAILCSGVWTQKYEQELEVTDTRWISGTWDRETAADVEQLRYYVSGESSDISHFTGDIIVTNGVVSEDQDVTLISAKSLTTEYLISDRDSEEPFSGVLSINNGVHPFSQAPITGEVRVHSVALTNKAFTSTYGRTGSFIVSICLILFAFTSIITWFYYGKVAWCWLFGSRYLVVFEGFYILAFVTAAISDTSLVWLLSNVAIAIMALPNLFSLLFLMHKVRRWSKEYLRGDGQKLVKQIEDEFPSEKNF